MQPSATAEAPSVGTVHPTAAELSRAFPNWCLVTRRYGLLDCVGASRCVAGGGNRSDREFPYPLRRDLPLLPRKLGPLLRCLSPALPITPFASAAVGALPAPFLLPDFPAISLFFNNNCPRMVLRRRMETVLQRRVQRSKDRTDMDDETVM